jgi:hypothetical protein
MGGRSAIPIDIPLNKDAKVPRRSSNERRRFHLPLPSPFRLIYAFFDTSRETFSQPSASDRQLDSTSQRRIRPAPRLPHLTKQSKMSRLFHPILSPLPPRHPGAQRRPEAMRPQRVARPYIPLPPAPRPHLSGMAARSPHHTFCSVGRSVPTSLASTARHSRSCSIPQERTDCEVPAHALTVPGISLRSLPDKGH